MAREYKDVVVGLDIGTSKVMAVVAEVVSSGELKLAGATTSSPDTSPHTMAICASSPPRIAHIVLVHTPTR